MEKRLRGIRQRGKRLQRGDIAVSLSAETPRGVLHATDCGLECTLRGRREKRNVWLPTKLTMGASVRGAAEAFCWIFGCIRGKRDALYA
jgi:hypothetical protein